MIPKEVVGQQLMFLMRRKEEFAEVELKGGAGSYEQGPGGAGSADEQGTSGCFV